MSGILQSADNLIIAAGYAVVAPSEPAAPCTGWPATATRTWPATLIALITDKDEVSSRVDKDAIEEHLAGSAAN